MPVIRQDLLPGAPKAMKIKNLIRQHIDMSWQHISQNFHVWDKLEQQYRAYRPTDDADRESIEKHGVQKIIIPYQYATIQTMLTFIMEVFTAMKPTLRVRGADPASVRKARVMEAALDYDYRNNRGYLMLQQWFLNAFRYQYGIMENTWGRREILRKMITQGPSSTITLEGQEFEVPGAMEMKNDWFVTFEGNTWTLIDNRQWFPDPRVPLSRFQEGSFCARRTQIHRNDLIKMEESGLLFNTTKVSGTNMGSARDAELIQSSNERSRLSLTGFNQELTLARKNRMHVDEMIIIELIPSEFELSDEDLPQPWLFNLVDGEVITRAEPSPFYRYPWEVIECNPDMLASASIGIMELAQPMADHLNFLFNSHMANVRKAINDMLLVDPSRVDLRDLLDPNPGKLVRLLPLAYGTDPAAAIKQLGVVDITKGHIDDSKMILELWERIIGASSAMFGQIEPGRRTALEVQGVFRQSGSRMKMIADLFSAEGLAPLTEQMAILRQENMSIPQFMEIAGWTAADLGVRPEEIVEGWLKVRKSHLTGVFQYPAEEGVLPQDRQAASAMLDDLLANITRAPFLAQIFDPVAILRERVRQGGLKNIDDFMNRGIIAQTHIFSPEVINEYLASQQIVPANMGGAPPGRPNEGVRENAGTLTLAGAINGAGRSTAQ